MTSQPIIGLFGGDLRQVYMAEIFLNRGYQVAAYGLSESVNNKNVRRANTLSELFDTCSVLIGPVPMSRDGITIFAKNTSTDLTIAQVAYLLKKHHIIVGGNIPRAITALSDSGKFLSYDLMKDEKITILNAIATAEGTIMEAITGSDRNLHQSNCLVLGYGRCAKVLAQKLKGLDSNVTIAARSKDALALASSFGLSIIPLSDMKSILPSFHYIFNTIPSLILDKEALDLVNPQVTIIDIASAPGGVDFEYAKKQNLYAKLSLGLPGKVAPRTSAEILVTEIIGFLKERSD